MSNDTYYALTFGDSNYWGLIAVHHNLQELIVSIGTRFLDELECNGPLYITSSKFGELHKYFNAEDSDYNAVVTLSDDGNISLQKVEFNT